MNTAYFHLLSTHFPIIGLFFVFLLHIVVYIKKKEAYKFIALYGYILLSAFSFLAFFSGDGAAEFLRSVAKVSDSQIEMHENIAKIFLIGSSILSLLSVFILYRYKRNEYLFKRFNSLLLLLAFVTMFLAFLAAQSGGLIIHHELIR